ncbi:MAG: hypothetical protein OEY17_04975 [Nitrosopumilus sp.]|nr:hypothetical protein [Nitrosopumilus sp.]MDH5658673.1 hypothetical protein [Nitrosopumilus sp.]
MKEQSSLSKIKESVQFSLDKMSSFPEDIVSKWRIGRRNFP